jgi:hypothetical protein
MKTDFGYIKDEIREDDFVFGGGHVPEKQIINPKADYRPYRLPYEGQALKYETWACVAFSILRAIATQHKLLTGEELNFSERFIAVLGKIRKPGTSPNKIADLVRENGLIPQEKLPMPDTYEEFLTPDPMDVALLVLGQNFLNKWDIKHEWVWKDDDLKPEIKFEKLKKIMKYGTVCVSVYGWRKNGRVYFKREADEDNHFTFLEHIDHKDFAYVFDSYHDGPKVLEPFYNFERAKVFFLLKRTEPRNTTKFVAIGIIKTLLEALRKLFFLTKQEELKKNSMNDKLHELAKSKLGADFTQDWIVDDSVSCAFAVSTIIKELIPSMPIIINTGEFYRYMQTSSLFEGIKQPIAKIEAGTIIVAPTGLNSRPDIMPHGHICIASENERYMSNDSASGLWSQNYTRESFRQRYAYKGGFPIFVFRLKD